MLTMHAPPIFVHTEKQIASNSSKSSSLIFKPNPSFHTDLSPQALSSLLLADEANR